LASKGVEDLIPIRAPLPQRLVVFRQKETIHAKVDEHDERIGRRAKNDDPRGSVVPDRDQKDGPFKCDKP